MDSRAESSTDDAPLAFRNSRVDKEIKSLILLFCLFFLICLGLGYATLKRYDPRLPGNNPDSAYYSQMVAGNATQPVFWRYRILIPIIARPIYLLARGRIGTWDPVFLGLLVANSLFVAGTALVLVMIGRRVWDDPAVATIAGLLYLLNFAIANLQLAGFVDSGEAFFMSAVAISLLARKWFILPLWGVLGSLAKETFLPFSLVLALVWWAVEWRKRESRKLDLWWIAGMGAAGVLTMTTVQSVVSGRAVWPWMLAVSGGSTSSFLLNLVDCLTSHELIYVFGWLLPLGAIRLARLPRAWVLGSSAAALAALMLGASVDAHGNVARALFDTIGPMLSLSTANLIADRSSSRWPMVRSW